MRQDTKKSYSQTEYITIIDFYNYLYIFEIGKIKTELMKIKQS